MKRASDKGLPWGEQRLAWPRLAPPARWLEPEQPPPTPADPRPAARQAAAAVARRLRGGGRLALVVPDRTRPLPLAGLLPPVARALQDAGIDLSRVSLLSASGMHRPMTPGELRAWIGPEACEGFTRLEPHDARGPCARLGVTSSGIDVLAHPAAAEAAALLVLGRLVFHYVAGFGGGRKMLVPGIAGIETIVAMHARCLSPRPGSGRHPACRPGRLEGNPVHEAACQAAALFPPAVGLHVVVEPGAVMTRVTAGDLFTDHRREARRFAATHRVTVPEPVPALVVSAGGHPLDRNMVQANKALAAVTEIVRPGGAILLLARCADGVGNPELLEGLRLGSSTAIEQELRRRFRVGLHTALALRGFCRTFRVLALTEADDEVLELAGIERVADLAAGLARIGEITGDEPVVVAPRGAGLLYSTLQVRSLLSEEPPP
ncbi:MAG: lactate racemase domain-containing protein [Acidobacteriota bacterium]|nr:lactate racemase domain-containing protein [Acidobacteriota bacterium]MDQ7087890.1 lactate racemase domain-containing protein [Acidobacteriota bacterium]